MRLQKWLLAVLFVPAASFAQCPLGKGETELNVHRVMINFGRYTRDADFICVKSKNTVEKISDAEIADAVAKLGTAIACADAVITNPTASVLPSKLNLMKDEKEKADLIEDYLHFMNEFKDELVSYQNLFKDLLALPADQRQFNGVEEKRQDLDVLVKRAHKKL